MTRRIRFWWEEDVHTAWRRLYAKYRRAGASKRDKRRTNRYDRHVEKPRAIREGER